MTPNHTDAGCDCKTCKIRIEIEGILAKHTGYTDPERETVEFAEIAKGGHALEQILGRMIAMIDSPVQRAAMIKDVGYSIKKQVNHYRQQIDTGTEYVVVRRH